MDVELRKAIRTLFRAGYEEPELLDLHLELVLGYLDRHQLPVVFEGIAQLPPFYTAKHRVMSSGEEKFLYDIDLYQRPAEEIFKICCQHVSWNTVFHLVSMFSYYKKNVSTKSIWARVHDGQSSDYLTAEMEKLDNFYIGCRLVPLYMPETRSMWNLWSSHFLLVGQIKTEAPPPVPSADSPA